MQTRNKKRFIDSSDLIPLFILGTLGLEVFNLLTSSGSVIALWSMAHKPAPAMVQLVDGKPIAMQAVDTNQRTPATIREFVKNSLGLMFTWNAKLPTNSDSTAKPGEVLKDPGVAIGNGGRITTASWQAAFALKEDFRNPFLEQVTALPPNNDSFTIELV